MMLVPGVINDDVYVALHSCSHSRSQTAGKINIAWVYLYNSEQCVLRPIETEHNVLGFLINVHSAFHTLIGSYGIVIF